MRTEKRKVGIITYHRFINYGGLLQAYALCEKLRQMGAEATVIDYRCANLENVGNSDLFCKGISFKRRIWKLFSFFELRTKEKLFENFIENHMSLSKSVSTLEELKDLSKEYDLIITGSDQVWHSKWPYDEAYFLTFVEESFKKASYAASLGDIDIPKEKEAFYQSALKDYKCISVREAEDKKRVEELLGRTDVETVIDPVLLLEEEKWKEHVERASEKIKKLAAKEYVLIYTVNEPENLVASAKDYAKKNGLKIIYLNPSFVQNLKVFGVTKIKRASLYDFLFLFANSKKVFTNSFHGTAFSVLFEKDMTVETISNGHRNKRAANLLFAVQGQEKYENVLTEMRKSAIKYIERMLMLEK